MLYYVNDRGKHISLEEDLKPCSAPEASWETAHSRSWSWPWRGEGHGRAAQWFLFSSSKGIALCWDNLYCLNQKLNKTPKQQLKKPNKTCNWPTHKRKKTQHTFCALLQLWLLCQRDWEMIVSSSFDLHVRLQSLMSEKNANTEGEKGDKFLLAYL